MSSLQCLPQDNNLHGPTFCKHITSTEIQFLVSDPLHKYWNIHGTGYYQQHQWYLQCHHFQCCVSEKTVAIQLGELTLYQIIHHCQCRTCCSRQHYHQLLLVRDLELSISPFAFCSLFPSCHFHFLLCCFCLSLCSSLFSFLNFFCLLFSSFLSFCSL